MSAKESLAMAKKFGVVLFLSVKKSQIAWQSGFPLLQITIGGVLQAQWATQLF